MKNTGSELELVIAPGDITKLHVDAIVNAANSSLLGGGGVDGAIHSAGGPEILKATKALRADSLPDGLPAGEAVETTAGELDARWVIHTVGPVYAKSEDRSHVLESCYRNSLKLAAELGAETIAFPAISAGIYGWPMDDAARIAVETTRAVAPEVSSTIRKVIFVPFGEIAEEAFEKALKD